ncbi:hypothetical protein Tco_0435780 [Tanacetum coccineum]
MILVYCLNVEVLLKPPDARSISNPDYITLLNQIVCIPQPMLQLRYPVSTNHISLLNNLALACKDAISNSAGATLALRASTCSVVSSLVRRISTNDEPLNLLRGGSNSIGGGDTAGATGKGGVCGMHLLRDGLADGGGESEANDDLLRDGPEYGDDGVDDEDPNSNDDEYCWIDLLNRSKPSACKEFAPLDNSKATISKH